MGNKMALFLLKRTSRILINDHVAMHASEAACSILEEPAIRPEPEVAKHEHKRSIKTNVSACSIILLAVSFSVSEIEI
jgi:hypothetical protein